jgi:hypothetical protein
MTSGVSVMQYAPKSKAADEIEHLCDEIEHLCDEITLRKTPKESKIDPQNIYPESTEIHTNNPIWKMQTSY